ncbi:uncharacterized protein LOC143883807 [Tasmannia lanceolata]|uniref:uncharacterized protein LOC143883807 n=1 Tax=Tasmannia lanceolata TaxID=3420 RepID=UPI004062A8AA
MSEQNPPILKLIIEKGPRKGETLECNPNSSIRIGRVIKGNNCTIKDAGISQKHLKIEFISGKWSVTDLETSNGTVLNSVTIPSMTPSCLEEGDIIKIGEKTSIMVKFEGKISVNVRYPKKRGRSIKEEPNEVDEIGNLGLGLERLEEKISVDVVEEKQLNRYALRRGRSKKEEPKQVEEKGNLGLESCGGMEKNDLVGNRLRRNPRRGGGQKKHVEEEPECLDSARVLISRAKNAVKKLNVNEKSLVENYGGGGENSVADVENLGSGNDIGGGNDLGPVKNNSLEGNLVPTNDVGDREDLGPAKNNALEGNLVTANDIGDRKDLGPVKNNALEGNLVPTNDIGDREDLGPAKNNALEGNLVPTDDIGDREDLGPAKNNAFEGNLVTANDIGDKKDLGPAKNNALDGNRLRRNPRRAEAQKKPVVSEEEPEPLDLARVSISETRKPLQKSSLEEKSLPENSVGGDEKPISVMENFVPANDNAGRKDLEKITLGEWFDRMERYLPKQINDFADELIEDLRERQKQFEEFLAQQSDGKGELPVAN